LQVHRQFLVEALAAIGRALGVAKLFCEFVGGSVRQAASQEHWGHKAPAAGVEHTRKGFAAMTTEPIEIEDLLAALKAGRKPRDHGPYKVKVGDHNLNFTDAVIDDPTPTGRQVIEGAGFRKAEEHLVFQMLRNGELEELRLEETTDLRPGRVERFLVFPSAESFRFDIDGKRLEWGHKVISGRVLKKLAGVDPAKFAVWQVIPGEDDILVGDTDLICLADAGLEHFFTGVPQTTEGGAA
jgi:Multiubiquitin